MAIGGFNNNGGEITLAQFIRDVRAGEIHYYIASARRGRRPGRRRLLERDDHLVGAVALPRRDDRRRDRLRPDRLSTTGGRARAALPPA